VKRRRHTPEQIIRKLREADRLFAEGREVPEVAKQLEVTQATGADDERGNPRGMRRCHRRALQVGIDAARALARLALAVDRQRRPRLEVAVISGVGIFAYNLQQMTVVAG
jgi:hypothetical protein